MEQSVFIIFLVLSVVVAVTSITEFFVRYFGKKTKDSFFKPFYGLLLGVFIAAVLLFIPVFYLHYDFGDTIAFIRPFLLSVKTAFAIFFVNEDFELIKNSAGQLMPGLNVFFSSYAAVLFVIAPVLTVGTVISFIKRFSDEFRFLISKKKKLYVLSDINKQSLYLAKSIRDRDKEENVKDSVIIFQKNIHKDDEEFTKQVKKLGLIYKSKDVVEILNKYETVEFFVVGEDEDENVSRTIEIVNGYNKNTPKNTEVSVYIFSAQGLTGTIIDSLDKKNLVNDDWVKKINSKTSEELQQIITDNERQNFRGKFHVRRVDPTYLMIIKLLSEQLFDTVFKDKKRRELSFMIIGLGEEGRRIAKTLLWMYQLRGYNTEINIFEKNEEAFKQFEYECPEFNTIWHSYESLYNEKKEVKINHKTVDGESSYLLNFYTGIDVFSNEFEKLIEKEPDSFKKTQVIFVLTGDDDINIKASLKIREIFSDLNNINDEVFSDKADVDNHIKDIPAIYSVVYDENKSKMLQKQNIKNHKGTSYNIHYIDNLSSQYSYDRIKEQQNYEDNAVIEHLQWAYVDLAIQKQTKEEINMDYLKSSAEDYENYEYYRMSSISRVTQREKIVSGIFTEELSHYSDCKKNNDTCDCELCTTIRITEHMRWNAYMRSRGYRHGKYRNDRAKRHPFLVSWNRLPKEERMKD